MYLTQGVEACQSCSGAPQGRSRLLKTTKCQCFFSAAAGQCLKAEHAGTQPPGHSTELSRSTKNRSVPAVRTVQNQQQADGKLHAYWLPC